MNTGYIFISIILLLRIVQNYCNKKVSNIFPETLSGKFKYVSLSLGGSAAFAGILLFFNGTFTNITAAVVICSVISGISLAIAQLCSYQALQSGTMVINSVFATAGLIVPCIFGIFFFDEKMSVMQWVGLIVFIFASYILSSSAKTANSSFSLKTVLLLIGSLLSNGATMVCQKFLTFYDENANITAFSFLSFLIPSAIFAMGVLFARKENRQEKLNTKLYPMLIMLAIALFVINQLSTIATEYVSSVVLFALTCGGNTIIAAIIAATVFKEKTTVKSLIGLIIALASLMIINIF